MPPPAPCRHRARTPEIPAVRAHRLRSAVPLRHATMRRHTLAASSSLALLAAVAAAQQQVTLPDNHHLSENPFQLGSAGSPLWWRTGPGRFQVLYEGSHFTSAGVVGPVQLRKLRFRGEDGEINLGGQVYTNVAVRVGSTSLAASALSSTFATNVTPPSPAVTTMSSVGTATVTVQPSLGTVPNNWNIEIDLLPLGIVFQHDPASALPNLLIDVTMPNAPSNAPPLALIAMQDTTGPIAVVRGNSVTAATSGAATGVLNARPPVVGIELAGLGGYTTVVPARNEFFGAACGGQCASWYQAFLNGQAFDLGAGITMTPDSATAPTVYTVSVGAPPPDTTRTNAAANATLDDDVHVHPLGFAFAYPGGSTSTIVASTNGFVWLDATMTDSQFAPVIARFLGDGVQTVIQYSGARLAPFWHDLNMTRNVGLNPLAGLHVRTVTSGGPGNAVCYVTWCDVGATNAVGGAGVQGHTRWTFQLVLFEATGVVQFRYGPMPAVAATAVTTFDSFAAIVGFSRGKTGGVLGTNANDPQNRDVSLEGTFTTQVEGTRGHVGQLAFAWPNAGGAHYGGRLYVGQTASWNGTGLSPTAVLGAQLLDLAPSRPGLQLPGLTAPGCALSTTTGAVVWQVFVLTGAGTAIGTRTFPVPGGFLGTDLYAQFVVLDGLLGGPHLITAASNAIRQTIGLN
jgi:hypothetical protein